MHSIAQTATAPSTLPEQAITASLTAEIMHDPDDGQVTLVASSQGNQGDLQVVTVDQMLARVTEARTQLDQIEHLAKVFQAQTTLAAVLAEHGARMEEWNPDTAPSDLRDKFVAAVQVIDGQIVVVVPLGQDPLLRAAVVAELISDVKAPA
ncbi:hypothetical protein AB0N92_04050 [Streptomyces sp. NPDC093248]|uniref:hypothetical protein n=1 Tax=Streptomyces sp. NPDC093248 TaxID=3155072 RepID=UPI003432D67F